MAPSTRIKSAARINVAIIMIRVWKFVKLLLLRSSTGCNKRVNSSVSPYSLFSSVRNGTTKFGSRK